jgi:hypothetical protein
MISVKQFSLLDYTLSIYAKSTDGRTRGRSLNIPIGGSGKYLGSIKFTKSTDNVSKTVDATGAGVFGFTNDHSGTVDIEISQVSDAIKQILFRLANSYHNNNWKNTMVDIVMFKGSGTKVIEATNCMLVRMPDLEVASEVATRTFSFVAMEIKEAITTY